MVRSVEELRDELAMHDLDVPVFDDPGLKAVLRRNYPAERAPQYLRERIRQSLNARSSALPVSLAAASSAAARPLASPRPSFPKSAQQSSSSPIGVTHPAAIAAPTDWAAMMPGLAIAAMMLIAIGTISFFLARSSPSAPQTFELAAIARHDGCCKAADHHEADVPQASFVDMGRYLRQELNHPVLAADMGRERWQFRGAAICPVAGVPAAHLLFGRGKQTLSIFSLPASSLPSLEDNQTCEGAVGDHSVVARREGDAIYCLVGHCPKGQLTVAELDRMLAAHESEATVAAAAGPRITVAGILREQ